MTSELKKEQKAAVKQLENSLECSICKDYYIEPVTLLCGHSFCRECISDVETKCCPTCNLRFWVPVNNNFALIEMTKSVYGEEVVDAKMKKLQQERDNAELLEKLKKEALKEIWRDTAEDIAIDKNPKNNWERPKNKPANLGNDFHFIDDPPNPPPQILPMPNPPVPLKNLPGGQKKKSFAEPEYILKRDEIPVKTFDLIFVSLLVIIFVFVFGAMFGDIIIVQNLKRAIKAVKNLV